MEENLGTSQAPIQTPGSEGNLGRLESELDEIKKRAQSEGNPFNQTPVNDGGGIIKIGLILFSVSVVIAGIYIVKTLIGKRNQTVKVKEKVAATSSPAPASNLIQGWKVYSDPVGYYSFSYPTDYSLADNKEGIYTGAIASKNEGFGVKYGKDYVKIKTLFLKGITLEAKEKADELRTAAAGINGQEGKVSQVEEIKVGGRTAYKYKVTGSDEMMAEDIVLKVGRELLRIQVEYQMVDFTQAKYDESVGKILSSFTFSGQPAVSTASPSPSSLPNTGIYQTSEPEGSTNSSSFGNITQ